MSFLVCDIYLNKAVIKKFYDSLIFRVNYLGLPPLFTACL